MMAAGAAGVLILWVVPDIDRRLVAVASVALAVFILCRMPTWCCAERTRGGLCEKNTFGVFAGCGEAAHRDRKRDLVRTRAYWSGLARGRYSGMRGAMALYLATAAAGSALLALAFTVTA